MTGRRVRKRWIILLAISIALALISPAVRLSMFADWIPFHRIIAWVNLARSNRSMAAAFYLIYAVGVMVLPITMFPIIGGVLFSFWIALPLNIVAATVGAWFSFRVGRVFGRVAIEPLLRGNVKALDRLAASRGMRTVFLMRLIGIPPFIVTNYGLGLSGVKDLDFVLGTAAGIVPWMALVTSLSMSLWNAVLVGGEKGMMRALVKALAPLTTVSVLVLLGVVAAWYVRGRRARATTRTYTQSPQS